MEALRLALRGLRWRSGPSIAVLVVAMIAMAGAALGPLYARSAEESLVRDGLAQSAPVTTGIQTRGNIAGQTEYKPAELAAAVEKRADDPALDLWYSAPTLSLTVLDTAPLAGGRSLGRAQVSWYRGECGAVTLVSGRCPSAPGEAMLSGRSAESAQTPIGTVIQLGITSEPAADRVTVVGTYDPTTYDPAVWGLGHPGQAETARVEGGPDRLDEIVVDEATMLRSNGDLAAVSLRTLEATSVFLGDLDELRAAVETATAVPESAPSTPRTLSISSLPDYLDSLQPQLDAVAAASFAVAAQLVLLSWFVLFLIVSATGEERSGEIALAKLRGMTPRSTLAFGLAQPVLLLVFALPLGLMLAYLVDVLLTSRYLVPGTTVTLSPAVLAALLLCFLGGAAAAALAARGILTAPVLEQLRRTGGRRARLARSSAVDATAVALAVAGIYELNRGRSDSLALLAPGLIALAVGLLAVRVLPWLARIEVARTRSSPNVASFLSSRNIARRPSGLRIVVLLSLAVGLAVFAVDGWVVAAANRSDLARAEIGSAEVLRVHASSPGALLAAVAAADPAGTEAMAAVGSDNGAGGLLAVDARRLAAVSSWDPSWAGTAAAAAVGPLLHPQAQTDPLLVHGKLTLTADYVRKLGSTPVRLTVAVRASSGVPSELVLGVLRPGTATYSVELPSCVDSPCTLTAFTFSPPIDIPTLPVMGEVTFRDVADASGAVDLTSVGQSGWRSGAAAIANPIESGAEVTTMTGGQLAVLIEVGNLADAAIEVADHPLTLPVLQGSDYSASNGVSTEFPVLSGIDGRYVPIDVAGTGVLPRLLRNGSLVDLPYALADMGAVPSPLDYQVWLSASAPPSVLASLQKSGLDVIDTESLDDREGELARGGNALALRLFLLAALVALVLGAGTLLANAYVVIRRRAYELAALRALGARRSVLVRGARREQVVLALTGVVLGAAAGLGAAAVALPSLLASAGRLGPPPWFGPAWVPVIALLAVVLVLLVVVADLGARRTVRLALPDLLRQVQE